MNLPGATSPETRPPRTSAPWSGAPQALAVLLLCVLSRAATTIRHIEDADSLRFALGVLDFDITKLQPQFPGYAAFMGVVKLFHALLGSYALAFSVMGGLGLFVLIHYGLATAKWKFSESRGLAFAALMFFNPMLWLLGNRYMSDLSGAACMLAAFYHLSRTDSRRHVLAGFFLTGLLAGWRLSYAPFLLAPLALGLLRRAPGAAAAKRARAATAKLAALAAGVMIWLLPMIAVTGWRPLLATARVQTAAHFTATGGTYVTETSWPLRVQRLFTHLGTDGLGAWVPGRHPVTILVGLGAATLLVLVLSRMRQAFPDARFRLLFAATAGYAAWILLFQNVVHQTRHVLPLVPPLLILLAAGIGHLRGAARPPWARGVAAAGLVAFLAAYGAVGLTLARQHMRPAAIAQVLAHLEADPPPAGALVVTAPWVQKCLTAQGLSGDFLVVETPEELEALGRLDPGRPVLTIGNYTDRIRRPVTERRVFYHNPYVNRLGARIEVFRYGAAGKAP